MVDVKAEPRLTHARWFLGHKRRWPLCLAVFAAVALTFYGIVSAHGRFAALANLPQSRAAFERLASSAVQESENAAPVWKTATRAVLGLDGTLNGKQIGSPLKIRGTPVGVSSLNLQKSEWQSDEMYAAEGAARVWVALNEEALGLALRAAAMDGCAWSPVQDSHSTDKVYAVDLRGMARLCATRARVAAFDGDWALVEQHLRAIAKGAEHVRSTRREWQWLLAMATDFTCVDALEDCLTIARVPPSVETLRRLRAFAVECHGAPTHLAEMHEAEKRLMLLEIDLAGAREKGSWADLPAPLDASPATYSCARSLTERVMNDLIASERELEATGRYGQVDFDWKEIRILLVPNKICPALYRYRLRHLELRALWRVAASALAVMEYRLTHQGTWPKTLAETGLEPALLKDPCLEPEIELRCRASGDGDAFWIWSVGKERADLSASSESEWRAENIVFRVPALSRTAPQGVNPGKAGAP